MLIFPMSLLADTKSFDPFPQTKGAPFDYPGSYEPGRKLNNQSPGNMSISLFLSLSPPPTQSQMTERILKTAHTLPQTRFRAASLWSFLCL